MILKKFVVGDMANNNYLLMDNGEAVLIDCTGDIPEIDSVLKENHTELKYILLTHAHFDHIAGVKKLQDKYGSKVCLHEDDKDFLENTDNFMRTYGLDPIDIPTIDIYLKEGDKIKFGNDELEVIHLPGHTPGGAGYLIDNMIFSGDTIFLGSVGRTDLPGGNFDTLKSSINDKLLKLNDSTIIYTGHGSETSVKHE
ncbi:MAG: MBL fold metallo-hydrolase, partial [Candidatus Gastranaerophilales bacterium]|nr:MBL fold metallo-hydrolase [Candidatus Gastranaerophilales bacterium]